MTPLGATTLPAALTVPPAVTSPVGDIVVVEKVGLIGSTVSAVVIMSPESRSMEKVVTLLVPVITSEFGPRYIVAKPLPVPGAPIVAPVSAGMIAEAVTLLAITAEVLKVPLGDIVVVEATVSLD